MRDGADMPEPRKTPMYGEHTALKALMAPFPQDGACPIHYGSILDETRHTRTSVSIFDITHMGEFMVLERPDASSLDRAMTIPVTKMKTMQCRYGFLLNENGTILDDLIAYRIAEDSWMLVVNASNEESDFDTIKKRLSAGADFKNISSGIVKIDVQGPMSMEVMKGIAGDGIKRLGYFGFGYFEMLGGRYIISRTGYTGELGYEVYIDADKGVELWRELMKHPAVKPAGLGARDILRLEMGLPLYGSDITDKTTPIDAGMTRYIEKESDFVGKDALAVQRSKGAARRLIGFTVEGRRTPRHENNIMVGGTIAGTVTSGVFSPI